MGQKMAKLVQAALDLKTNATHNAGATALTSRGKLGQAALSGKAIANSS